mmetsp:Transcript_21001/g.46032  ORF Transcript_21001/g.46032 Transcript_21001/m.46032 type:complete len:83 (-) Transcript_21001:913-1161(-)
MHGTHIELDRQHAMQISIHFSTCDADTYGHKTTYKTGHRRDMPAPETIKQSPHVLVLHTNIAVTQSHTTQCSGTSRHGDMAT